jgi:hypothetical protein
MNAQPRTEADLTALFLAESDDVSSAEQLLARLPLADPNDRPGHYRRSAQRPRSRWAAPVIAAAAVLLAVVATVAGIGLTRHDSPATHQTAPPPAPATISFTGGGLSFDYPTNWMKEVYQDPETFSTSIVFLSNQPLRTPCTTHNYPDGSGERSCGATIAVPHLKPDGIVLVWQAVDGPGPFRNRLGQQTTVAGRPAKTRAIAADKNCSDIGGSTTLTIAIAGPANLPDKSTYFYMYACLGPVNQQANQAAVHHMLATLTVTR